MFVASTLFTWDKRQTHMDMITLEILETGNIDLILIGVGAQWKLRCWVLLADWPWTYAKEFCISIIAVRHYGILWFGVVPRLYLLSFSRHQACRDNVTPVKSKLSYLRILKQGCHEGKHRSMCNKYRDHDGCNRKSGPLEMPCIRRWFSFCWMIKVKNEKLENKNYRSINMYHLT